MFQLSRRNLQFFLDVELKLSKGKEMTPETCVCYESNKPIKVIQSPDMLCI